MNPMTTSAEYGILTDYATGEEIRPATADEHARSLAAGETGAFDLDGRVVFVAGGPEEAVTTTYLATVSTAGTINDRDAIGVDQCSDGEVIATPWTRDLTPAEMDDRDWDALLAAAGWTVTSGWADHGGYWTATVERANCESPIARS